ncbi:hypothetical protein LB504_004967, partial [Fusarium proliferatum]
SAAPNMLFPLFAVLALVLPVHAISSSNSTYTPEKVQTRIEWADMASDGQKYYLKAVKCLKQLPVQTGIKGAVPAISPSLYTCVRAALERRVRLKGTNAMSHTTSAVCCSNWSDILVARVIEDIDASPGDPLLYIHHVFIDRLWWKWQSENLGGRLYQLGGPTAQGGTEDSIPDYVITTYGIRPNVTVKEAMDFRADFSTINTTFIVIDMSSYNQK